MGIYKHTIHCSAVLCIFSFFYALLKSNNTNDFWVNISVGIFASSLLILVTSTIDFSYENKKAKAEIYYEIKQLHHLLKQFQLYLNMHPDRVNTLISTIYKLDYDINGIGIKIYLSTANDICSPEICNCAKYVQNKITQAGKQLYESSCIDTRRPELPHTNKICEVINTLKLFLSSPINQDDYINYKKECGIISKRTMKVHNWVSEASILSIFNDYADHVYCELKTPWIKREVMHLLHFFKKH